MADQSDSPVLDLLAGMTADSIEAGNLDPDTLMLVRIAALAAIDAPPASYLMNLGAASELGIGEEQVRGVLPQCPDRGDTESGCGDRKHRPGVGFALEMAELARKLIANCVRP